METITFYSYKGGTGRTLLVAHTARYLALSGKRVVALDLDLEAPGLHYRLAPGTTPYRGVTDYLVDSLGAGRAPEAPLTDYVLPIAVPEGTDGRLWLFAAGPAPSGSYWKQLTSLLHLSPFLEANGTALAAVLDLKARIEDELTPDYLLIDARTGITEIGGMATSVLADKVVCLFVDNRESIDGTRAVIRSLRKAERPSGYPPVQVFPVLSRVTGDLEDLDEAKQFALEDLNSGATGSEIVHDVYPIRADPRIDNDDTSPASSPSVPLKGAFRDYRFLLSALMPAGQSGVSPAWARHVAVHQLVEWLISGGIGDRHRPVTPRAFRAEQIAEGLHIGDRGGVRYADVVVFASADDAKPILVAEYVDGDPRASTSWEWWQEHSEVRALILFSLSGGSVLDRRVFTRERFGEFVDRGDEWAVRWPLSFTLEDPGDLSTSALLRAVRSGEDGFVALLVQRWQNATYFGIHGGFDPDPAVAKEIIDGLASVRGEHAEWAIFWRTAPDVERLYAGMMGEEVMLEQHTTEALHAPLWWRLSAKGKIRHWQALSDRNTVAGIKMLASEIMGLTFDQDREFRAQAARLGRSKRRPRDFTTELDFEMHDGPPPELIRRVILESVDVQDSPGRPAHPKDVSPSGEELAQRALDSDEILDRLLRGPDRRPNVVTTNLLGGYDPTACRVTLYTRLVAWCARAIDCDPSALENVVLLHETVHALCHVGLDLDGCRWDEFALPMSTGLTFRPSALHEGLAQYFTFRMLERLADGPMMDAFERLTSVQPPEYEQWRRMRAVPAEVVRGVLIQARAGLANTLSALH